MGASVSEVRPRPAPDMVTSCCIARKGNFRHGPALQLEGLERLEESDEEKKVRWRPLLEERLELPESEDWARSRKNPDLDLQALPEKGVSLALRPNWQPESGQSAASKRAARRKQKAEPEAPQGSA